MEIYYEWRWNSRIRKLLKFKNGEELLTEGIYIRENADFPEEELDLSFLKNEDYIILKKNIKDKKIRNIIDKSLAKE
ncbi:MAG: hypothetical protein AABY15_09795 [Nanoarchaeota archaeon]